MSFSCQFSNDYDLAVNWTLNIRLFLVLIRRLRTFIHLFVCLCVFPSSHRRKKKPQPLADSSAEPTDVIIDDPRKGFTFDDPYQSIDISDEVKTLSSAESGDSAFDTSPSDSGHDIQVNGENPTSSTVNNNEQQQFSSPFPAVNSNTFSDSVDDVKDEPVYEMIAFEGDGGVNHNPTPDVASSLRQDCDVSDLQTYEDVGGDVEEAAARVACGSQKLAGEEGVDPGLEDDDVFDTEPLYTPVYESSIYVDCVSRSADRKDSGVVLDTVPSPTESTHGGPASASPFCKSHSNALSRESSESSNNATDAGLHWASIKSQVNELKKLKKLKASASLPHEEGGGGCPEVFSNSDSKTEDRGAPSSPRAGCHPVTPKPVQSGENIFSSTSPEGTAKLPTSLPSECCNDSTNTASTPEDCDGSPQGTVPLPSECRDDSTKLSARALEDCDGSPQGTVPLPSECRDDSTKLSARALEDCDGSPEGTVPLPSECRDDSKKLSARAPEFCDGSPQGIIPPPSECRDDSTKLSARALEEDCNGYPAQCATVPESALPDGSLAAVSPRKSSVQSQDGTGCLINTPRRGSKPVVPPKPPRKKQL